MGRDDKKIVVEEDGRDKFTEFGQVERYAYIDTE
jgi:hypothetical protein